MARKNFPYQRDLLAAVLHQKNYPIKKAENAVDAFFAQKNKGV